MRTVATLLLLATVTACTHASGSAPAAGALPAQPVATPGSPPAAVPASPPAAAPGPSGAAGPADGVDQTALAQFIRARFVRIKTCYEEALKKDASLAGKVVIRFTLQPDGRLADVAVVSTALATSSVGDCMVAEMSSWRANLRPRGPVTVEYPFVFAPVR